MFTYRSDVFCSSSKLVQIRLSQGSEVHAQQGDRSSAGVGNLMWLAWRWALLLRRLEYHRAWLPLAPQFLTPSSYWLYVRPTAPPTGEKNVAAQSGRLVVLIVESRLSLVWQLRCSSLATGARRLLQHLLAAATSLFYLAWKCSGCLDIHFHQSEVMLNFHIRSCFQTGLYC